MLVLGIESSAVAASCAVCDLGDSYKIIAQSTINTSHTHSQTLMPMIENMLEVAGLGFDDIDRLAVANGPGSFTGIRIGVSTVKGLAYAQNKPCVGVSSLEALAMNLLGFDGIICPVMDARRNQVYNALFSAENGTVTRLCGDRAISVDELGSELSAYNKKIWLCGDGAIMTKARLKNDNAFAAPPLLLIQSAVSVCLAAMGKQAVSARELMPLYLRLSQAERERIERQENHDSNRI